MDAPAMSNAIIDETALPCPLCEYDLRATVEPRCPECGHAFDRVELRNADLRHPYLFDQQLPRNIRPFIRTWLASLKPWTFWTTVKPQMRPGVLRLMIYWLASNTIIILILGGPIGMLASDDVARWYGGAIGTPWFDRVMLAEAAYPFALFLVWPWLTILAMNLFRTTLRAGSIRQGHLIRWAIYSAGFNILLLPVFAAAGYTRVAFNYDGFIGPFAFSRAVQFFLTGAIFVMPIDCALLALAYRRYLRLPQPIATVLLNQLVVWFAFWAILETIFDSQ
jgi:hypothetical protein